MNNAAAVVQKDFYVCLLHGWKSSFRLAFLVYGRPLRLDARYGYERVLEPSLGDTVQANRACIEYARTAEDGCRRKGSRSRLALVFVFCRVRSATWASAQGLVLGCRVPSLAFTWVLFSDHIPPHNPHPAVPLTINPYHKHAHISLTMATQRLSNVLSHITPGSKSPLEQMYAPSQSPLLPLTCKTSG